MQVKSLGVICSRMNNKIVLVRKRYLKRCGTSSTFFGGDFGIVQPSYCPRTSTSSWKSYLFFGVIFWWNDDCISTKTNGISSSILQTSAPHSSLSPLQSLALFFSYLSFFWLSQHLMIDFGGQEQFRVRLMEFGMGIDRERSRDSSNKSTENNRGSWIY